jgi:hypothetical protein
MPLSFYLISLVVFLSIAFLFYREAVAYAKKEVSQKEWKQSVGRIGALRPVLALSLVATVLIMLAVQYFFF